MPPQNNLRRRFAVFLRQLPKQWKAEVASLAERSPCLRHDALPVAEFNRRILLEPRIALDLVHRRADIRLRQKLLQMHRLEVAHTDRPDPARLIQPLQNAPRFRHLADRPVQIVHVEIVQPETLQRTIKKLLLTALAHILVPDFRRNKKRFPLRPAFLDTLADILLILVIFCRIDAAITRLNRVLHGVHRFLPAALPETNPDARDREAVVQFDRFCYPHNSSFLL